VECRYIRQVKGAGHYGWAGGYLDRGGGEMLGRMGRLLSCVGVGGG